ncbi:MAG: hypothetical protein ACYTFG_17410 [Planctomycetota bacterium]|jgi:hypothetical protein
MRLARIIAILSAMCVGCASYEVDYEIALEEVERTSSGSKREVLDTIRRMTTGAASVFLFEDDVLKFIWSPRAEEMRFKLVNKGDETLRIIWDEALYIDEKGVNTRLVHAGIHSNDAYKLQPPSLVVKKGILSEAVFPAHHVAGDPRPVDRGTMEPIFPMWGRSKDALKSGAQKVVGKTVRILLPVVREEKKTVYTFHFVVKGFAIR